MTGFLSQQWNVEEYKAEASHVFYNSRLSLHQSHIQLAFHNLNHTLKQHLRAWWKVSSLEKIVYRGIRPNTHVNNQELIKGWEAILTEIDDIPLWIWKTKLFLYCVLKKSMETVDCLVYQCCYPLLWQSTVPISHFNLSAFFITL